MVNNYFDFQVSDSKIVDIVKVIYKNEMCFEFKFIFVFDINDESQYCIKKKTLCLSDCRL